MNAPVPSKSLLSVLHDARDFVGKSRCSQGHSVNEVLDRARAGTCIYCAHQAKLHAELMSEVSKLRYSSHEPEVTPFAWTKVIDSAYDMHPRDTFVAGPHKPRHSEGWTPLFKQPAQPPSEGRWYAADDIDRLVRELDVLLNGESGAAKQAKLCDIVGQVSQLRRDVAEKVIESLPPPVEVCAAPSTDLRDYGYAPGNYTSHCLSCDQRIEFVDKRCRCCKACAQRKMDKAFAVATPTKCGDAT